jgi:hypothetical protein
MAGFAIFMRDGTGKRSYWDCRFTYLGSLRIYILAGSAAFMRERLGKFE